MSEPRHNQVGMNFIGKDQYLVFQADLCNVLKFLPVPATSNGVMRIAENQHRCIFRLFFKQVEVNQIGVFIKDQLVV